MSARLPRHHLIARLIGAGNLYSQAELAAALRSRGVEVTQATLSRDLAELGILKGPDGYVLPGEVNASTRPDLHRVLRDTLVSVEVGGTIVVLKTAPGQASILGVAIDASPDDSSLRGALGTIAGDDCLFIATRDARSAAKIAAALGASAELPRGSSRDTPRAVAHR
ncbi:MAG: arginine repressor [Planctomycetota bacterium]|nr:arginine repressor [Planctomycetota bacterium]MDA1105279.1 arginine repressor [Planctomycetota bacterium]